jgi:hypothetical protein
MNSHPKLSFRHTATDASRSAGMKRGQHDTRL